MPCILIDSIDKRMTIPLIEALVKMGYEVHGLFFSGSKVLSNRLLIKHEVSRQKPEEDLRRIYAQYKEEDYLILGNPLIMELTERINPCLKYLLPPHALIEKVEDKKWLMEFANALGIQVPKSNPKKFPMIVKLNNSEKSGKTAGDRYRIVHNEEERHSAIDFFGIHEDELLLQEMVQGQGIGVTLLLDKNSQLTDYIVHERLLEYPVSGGPSSLCQTIEAKDLVNQAYHLLAAIGWQGIAMVEFKGDTLLEINPRFWGTMPLIFCAGSTFFETFLKLLDHQDVKIQGDKPTYRIGKKMKYFPQVYLSVLQLLKKKKLREAFAAGLKSIPAKEGIWSIRNPKPFFAYMSTLWRR